jgi:hypothetical protein
VTAKKKLTKKLDNGFSDVSVAATERHSDDAGERAAADAVHGREMAFRATAATEGGGPFPRELLYQRLQPRTRWPK